MCTHCTGSSLKLRTFYACLSVKWLNKTMMILIKTFLWKWSGARIGLKRKSRHHEHEISFTIETTPWYWSSKLAVEKHLLSLPTNETKLLSTKCTLRRSVTFFVLSLLSLVLGFWIARAQKCWIIIISLSVVVEITTRRHKYSIHMILVFFNATSVESLHHTRGISQPLQCSSRLVGHFLINFTGDYIENRKMKGEFNNLSSFIQRHTVTTARSFWHGVWRFPASAWVTVRESACEIYGNVWTEADHTFHTTQLNVQ